MAASIADFWDISYSHAPGEINAAFLGALCRRVLLIRHCGVCGRHSAPPCGCWEKQGPSWSEASGKAALIAAVPTSGQPGAIAGFGLGLLQLEGCNTAIVQRIRLGDGAQGAGSEMRVVFAAEPRGTIEDFWFEFGRNDQERPA